ncbi:MAG: DUF4395 family protein [Armatimonadetes bacterium]|nr:DUF4395 family protein [Armatimonadota bacterium]
MTPRDTVMVPRDAFRFCRWSMAALMWAGVLSHSGWPIFLCWLLMALSAVLTVRRSPVILLYTRTVHLLYPSPDEELSVEAMRFGQSVASVMIGVPLLLTVTGGPAIAALGWRILWFVAIFKTIGAAIGCPATKLYTCMSGGGACCSALKERLRGGRSC